MANVFTGDSSCVAVWRHETGALQTDTLNLNNLATNSGVTASATCAEGSYSGLYESSNADYQELIDASLSTSFPFKSEGTQRAFTICLWARFVSVPGSSANMVLFSKGTLSATPAIIGFNIEASEYSGTIYPTLRFNKASEPWTIVLRSVDGNLQTGRWYHFGATYDDATKAYKLRVWDATASALLGANAEGTNDDYQYVNDQAVRLGSDAEGGYSAQAFNGYLDEVVVFNRVLSDAEIDSIRGQIFGAASTPDKATTPSPANAATNQGLTTQLSWTAGTRATSHNVYFGTDSTPDETESKGNQAGTTYNPGTLVNNTTYYWRIDEVNDAGTTTGDVWSFSTPVDPDTYYVSPTGSDSYSAAQAKFTNTPWLTLQHALDSSSPGDTILMRGGTHYGRVLQQYNSGTEGSPITVKAYTGETPILTTATLATGWTQCDGDDANLKRGLVANPNATSIYKKQVTASAIYDVFENGIKLQMSVDPNLTHHDWVRVEEMRTIPNEGTNFHKTGGVFDNSTTITDATNLTQADDYWNGAQVAVWSHQANNWIIGPVTITDFDAASHKLTFDALDNPISNDGTLPDAYLIYNSPMTIDEPGEWCTVDLGGGDFEIYVWPNDTDSLTSGMSYLVPDGSDSGQGVIGCTNTSKGQYMTFDGLTFQNCVFGIEYVQWNGSDPYYGIIVQNCTFHQGVSSALLLSDIHNSLIDNCTIDGASSNGIQVSATDTAIRNCTITSNQNTGIYLGGGTRIEVSHNTIGETGTHGNGISDYGPTDVLIAYNTITTEGCSITYNYADTLTVWGNLLYKPSGASAIIDWGACTGQVLIAHNVVVGCGSIPYNEVGGNPYNYPSTTIIRLLNNIMTGPTGDSYTTHNHNIYTSTSSAGLGASESVISDITSIFQGASQNNFILKRSSPARGAGASVSSYLTQATSDFASFDFSKDILGRSWSSPPSMGAYEYLQSDTVTKAIIVVVGQ